MEPTYDRIGIGYGAVRRADPRLAVLIAEALGDARRVANIGAGTGSYEPAGPGVVAVDPSMVMLRQHPGSRRVHAVAESLPFADAGFDAAMAVMTVHHWSDLARGIREMRRVARRQVVFTWDPDHDQELWLVSEYLPEIRLGTSSLPIDRSDGRASASPTPRGRSRSPSTSPMATSPPFGDGRRPIWMPE